MPQPRLVPVYFAGLGTRVRWCPGACLDLRITPPFPGTPQPRRMTRARRNPERTQRAGRLQSYSGETGYGEKTRRDTFNHKLFFEEENERYRMPQALASQSRSFQGRQQGDCIAHVRFDGRGVPACNSVWIVRGSVVLRQSGADVRSLAWTPLRPGTSCNSSGTSRGWPTRGRAESPISCMRHGGGRYPSFAAATGWRRPSCLAGGSTSS